VPAQAAPTAANPPVSAAIQISNRSTVAGAARDALAAIDSVHDDGVLPDVTLDGSASQVKNALGFFQPGVPRIAVSATGPWPRLTATHEVGHLLDHRGIPGAGYTSLTAHQVDSPMHDWWQAIRASKAYRDLLAMPVNRTTKYLLEPYELWARSYAQYIAEVAGDQALANELAVSLSYQGGGMPRQWVGGDFDPVRDSITRLLADLGWTP